MNIKDIIENLDSGQASKEDIRRIHVPPDLKIESALVHHFPNLEVLSGHIRLSRVEDLGTLQKLELDNVTLDLNSKVSDTKQLEPLIRRDMSFTVYGFAGLGQFGLQLQNGVVEVKDFSRRYGTPSRLVLGLIPLLSLEVIDHLKLEHPQKLLTDSLPANITYLEIGPGFTKRDLEIMEPSHPIAIFGHKTLKAPRRLSHNIVQLNLPFGLDQIQELIEDHPHLEGISLRPDLSKYKMSELVEHLELLLQKWDGHIFLVQHDPKMKSHLKHQRIVSLSI